jgi:structure-specific endonuclease subunit SLX1
MDWSLGYEASKKDFFACSYLLTPCPQKQPKKHGAVTYVGFTLNPKRRIRQHNGELKQGAYFTRKHR